MTLQENLSNNARSENKNLFAEKIKKIIFNFPARRGWTRSQSWPEVHGEGGAGRQEGNPIGSLLWFIVVIIKIPRTILSAPCPSSWE